MVRAFTPDRRVELHSNLHPKWREEDPSECGAKSVVVNEVGAESVSCSDLLMTPST